MAVTINDIAREAGCSKATVSLILNEKGRISEETRRRVRDAAERLGYISNRTAVALRSKQTRMLGFVIKNLGNLYLTELIKNAEAAADQAGYGLIIYSTSQQERRRISFPEFVLSRVVDGLIYAADAITPEDQDLVRERKIPHVVLGSNTAGDAFSRIVLHLIAVGHQTIAHITGPGDVPIARRRRELYADCLARCGLSTDETLVEPGDFSLEGGRRAMQRLLDRLTPPFAVAAANDMAAFGAIQTAIEEGLQVPGDVAITGYDDVPLAAPFGLTTVRVSPAVAGHNAIARLLRQIDGAPPVKVDVPPVAAQVIIRRTCGASLGR